MSKTLYPVMVLGIAMTMGLTPESFASRPEDATSMLKAHRIELTHSDTTLRLTFEINPKSVKPGSNRQVMFTPIIRSLDPSSPDSAEMTPLVIAGRNRYFAHLRAGDIASGDLIYQSGKKVDVEYNGSVAWRPWMENSEVLMREETQDCCRPVKPHRDTEIATISPIETVMTNALESVDYVALTGDETVELEAQGSAYIDFPVNSVAIMEKYRSNPVELKKITESIDLIRKDPDATITRLSIKGFASPEGPYDNNVRLAMGRTAALKEYVRKMYDFNPEIITTDYEPEDWEGLRAWLEGSSLPERNEILKIVDSTVTPDEKDAAIRSRYPEQYSILLDSVYPGLRHSDYAIRYTIRTYIDIEELKEAYRNSPERLRPVDFYRLAQTFPVDSKEQEEIMLKASEIYPHDPEAAVNAANILMQRGDLEGASRKASLAGESGEAYYTRGILAILNGDYDRALTLLSKASDLGIDKARVKMETLPKNGAREMITYTTTDDNNQTSNK